MTPEKNEHLGDFYRLLEDHPAAHDDASSAPSWLLSYLDLMTLLLVLFVVLVSKATFDPYSRDSLEHPEQSAAPSTESHYAVASTGETSQEELLAGLKKQIHDLYGSGIQIKTSKKSVTITLPELLLFKSAEAKIESTGYVFLKRFSSSFKGIQGTIQIEGHADSDPIRSLKFPSNWELSSARAANVARVLHDMGIEKNRLMAVGFSDSKPAHPNDSPEGKKKNRRVVIHIRAD